MKCLNRKILNAIAQTEKCNPQKISFKAALALRSSGSRKNIFPLAFPFCICDLLSQPRLLVRQIAGENCTSVCHLAFSALTGKFPRVTDSSCQPLTSSSSLSRPLKEPIKAVHSLPSPFPFPFPLLFALSPAIYLYILLWSIFSAKVFPLFFAFMNENIEGLPGGWGRAKGVPRGRLNEMIFSVLFFRLIFIFTHFLRVVFASPLSFPHFSSFFCLCFFPKFLFSLLLVYPRGFRRGFALFSGWSR